MIKFFVSYFERPTPFRFVFKLQHHCDHCVCHVFGCNTVLPVCYPITSISANVYRYIVCFAGPLVRAPAYWSLVRILVGLNRSIFFWAKIVMVNGNGPALCLGGNTKVWVSGETIARKIPPVWPINKIAHTSVLCSKWNPPPPPPECHLDPDPECLLVCDITADCYDKLLKVWIETREHYNNVLDRLSRSKEGHVWCY